MLDAIKLYIAFSKVTFITQLEYRMAYILRTFGKMVNWFSGFVMIMVLLSKFQSMGGWSMYEILFLYAMNELSYALGSTFFIRPCQRLPRYIQSGNFDQVLTKPVNPLLYMICMEVSAGYTSNYIIGIVVMVICFTKLSIALSVGKIIWLVIVILGGACIHAAGHLATSVPAFWMIKNSSLANLFYRSPMRFIEYPLTIYNTVIQGILTFVLPYAFISFYPAQYFLGKEATLFHPALQFMTPLVGAVLLGGAYLFWLKGLNSYKSSGS